MKKSIIIIITALALAAATTPASAAVEGITADNYADWIKPNPDAYGYNIGECEREYLPGEEYFYNDYIDHWNVDRVYDAALVPQEPQQVQEEQAKPAAKKIKKIKKAKKNKKIKKNKKAKKIKK